ncbi:MAG: hypothetical protein ACREXX_07740 [Gammaproteobacteria bacterium]
MSSLIEVLALHEASQGEGGLTVPENFMRWLATVSQARFYRTGADGQILCLRSQY